MMKNKIYAMMSAMGLMCAVSSCDTWSPMLDKEGTVQLSDMALSVTDYSRAGVETANFQVVIKHADGTTVKQWTYSEMPEVFSLPVGEGYAVEAYSHEVQPAEWDAPYYLGRKTFNIEENRITNIGSVECKLSNVKVCIAFSDDLKAKMGDDCKVTVVSGKGGVLEFGKDETRAGYFAYDESMTLVATLSGTVDGEKIEVSQPFSDVKGGKFYDLTFAVNSLFPVPDGFAGTIGKDGITLTLEVEEVSQEGNIENKQDLIDPGKRPDEEQKPDTPDQGDPEDKAIEFIPSEDLNLNGVNKPSEYGDGSELAPGTKKALVTIKCPAGFAHIEVDIDSPYLTEDFMSQIEFSTHFDLVEPGIYEKKLKSFNFKVGNDVRGKPEVDFDITSLVPLLGLSGNDTMEHKFVITVTDANGKTAKQTLTFREK